MHRNKQILIGLVVLAVVFICVMKPRRKREGMQETSAIGPDPNISYKSGWLPSKQGPWFENLGPSLPVENRYHACVSEDCKGDYGDYNCLARCYVKTLKNGTLDKADLMCWQYRDDETAYYTCLDGIYGQYLWNDRFTGTQPCLCPGGSQGASTSDGRCHCPPKRPLNDRRPLDNENRVVTRLQNTWR